MVKAAAGIIAFREIADFHVVDAARIRTHTERSKRTMLGLQGLDAGDVLLVAGKGHESGQIVGDRILPFTDHEAVATALEDIA